MYEQMVKSVQQLESEVRSLNKKQEENDKSMKIRFDWFQKQVQTQTKRKENISLEMPENSLPK